MARLLGNGWQFGIRSAAVSLLGLALVAGGRANSSTRRGHDRAPTRVDQLIEQLGSSQFSTREKAQAELARMGLEAFDALYRARNHEDIEIAMRARYLVRSIPIRWTEEHDPLPVRRILRRYDGQGATERISRMQRLALLPQWQGTAALCRLVRFEASGVLSKRAALLVLRQPAADSPRRRASMAQAIRDAVGGSQRAAADWLRGYALFLSQPEASVETWAKLVRDEQEVFRQSPDITSYKIVRDLMRWHVEMLSQLGREDEAIAAMKRTVQLRNGAPEDLLELVDWLCQRSAWPVVDEVAEKYDAQFRREARLVYRLAESYQARGEDRRAEQTARRALDTPSEDRIVVASDLRDRGLFAWAEREYQHVIKTEQAGSRLSIEARISLAEMLHDQQRDLAAAHALQPAVDLIQSNAAARQMLKQWRNPNGIVSRMHFFYALHAAGQGNRAEQMDHLRKGIAGNPTDADVLIAMFRLPDPDQAWRKETQGRITATTDFFRSRISEARQLLEKIDRSGASIEYRAQLSAFLASNCNQLAWLVSNTQGDFQEALKCSQESLRLIPDEAGFLDTLGRCYYAVGDIEHAVKSQSRAVELEPHSGLIARQLRLFQEALDQSK